MSPPLGPLEFFGQLLFLAGVVVALLIVVVRMLWRL
jgi:hypothetical protein